MSLDMYLFLAMLILFTVVFARLEILFVNANSNVGRTLRPPRRLRLHRRCTAVPPAHRDVFEHGDANRPEQGSARGAGAVGRRRTLLRVSVVPADRGTALVRYAATSYATAVATTGEST